MTVFLVVFGAALQLMGFWLTFLELRREHRAVVDYLRIPLRIRARSLSTTVTLGGVAVTPGEEEPTIEQRMSAVEAAIARERQSRKDALRQLKESIDERMAEGDRSVARDLAERHAELEEALIHPGRWPFWLPVVLFAIGVGISAAGGLI